MARGTYLRVPAGQIAITQRDRDFEERLCADWSAAVVDEVAGDPSIDVVMTAAFNNIEWIPSRDRSGFDTAAAGYADVWSTWGAAGKQVVVLEETPLPRWSPGVPVLRLPRLRERRSAILAAWSKPLTRPPRMDL